MKISKQNATWIFVISILTILLALSIYLGASGWYFAGKQNYANDFQVGRTITLEAKANQSDAKSLNIEGTYLPNEKLPQLIAIKNYSDTDLFVRVKAKIENEEGVFELNVGATENWQYCADDGYYYLNELVYKDNKVSLCSYIAVDDNVILHSSKKYLITFVVEALDGGINIKEIWENFPVKSV